MLLTSPFPMSTTFCYVFRPKPELSWHCLYWFGSTEWNVIDLPVYTTEDNASVLSRLHQYLIFQLDGVGPDDLLLSPCITIHRLDIVLRLCRQLQLLRIHDCNGCIKPRRHSHLFSVSFHSSSLSQLKSLKFRKRHLNAVLRAEHSVIPDSQPFGWFWVSVFPAICCKRSFSELDLEQHLSMGI